MAQGNYDHPSYLTRQLLAFLTAAGANGTSGSISLPWDVRIHQLSVVVATAGTSSGAGNQVFVLNGTSTVGSPIVLGSGTAGTTGTSGDLNTKITAGSLISLKNGTDATGVVRAVLEYNIAPDTGTWLGTE